MGPARLHLSAVESCVTVFFFFFLPVIIRGFFFFEDYIECVFTDCDLGAVSN